MGKYREVTEYILRYFQTDQEILKLVSNREDSFKYLLSGEDFIFDYWRFKVYPKNKNKPYKDFIFRVLRSIRADYNKRFRNRAIEADLPEGMTLEEFFKLPRGTQKLDIHLKAHPVGLSEEAFQRKYRCSKGFFLWLVKWLAENTAARDSNREGLLQVTLREKVAFFLYAAGGKTQSKLKEQFARGIGTISKAIAEIRTSLALKKTEIIRMPPPDYNPVPYPSREGSALQFGALQGVQLLMDNTHIKFTAYGTGFVNENLEAIHAEALDRPEYYGNNAFVPEHPRSRRPRRRRDNNRVIMLNGGNNGTGYVPTDAWDRTNHPQAVSFLNCTKEGYYATRKSSKTTSILTVLDTDGRVCAVLPGSGGSANDTVTLEALEELENFHKKINPNALILCDQGYGPRKYILPPFIDLTATARTLRGRAYPNWPTREQEAILNKIQSSARGPLEKFFGTIKQKFPVLDRGNDYHTAVPSDWVLSLYVLHNLMKQYDEENCQNEADLVIPNNETQETGNTAQGSDGLNNAPETANNATDTQEEAQVIFVQANSRNTTGNNAGDAPENSTNPTGQNANAEQLIIDNGYTDGNDPQGQWETQMRFFNQWLALTTQD